MAIAVRGFYQVSNWFATGSPNNVTGVAWESGDLIVVAQYVSDSNSVSMVAPTNANLTFTSRQSTATGTNETLVSIHTAVAGSTQTGQTITSGRSGATNANGAAVWVFSGADAYRGGFTNRTESATSYTPLAGSAMVYFHADWNGSGGALTQTTNTGTRTERVDQNNGTWGSVWAGEWVGVDAGASSWGVTSYTGLKVTKAGIEITAAAAGGPTGTSATTLTRHTATGSGSTTSPTPSGSSAPTLARHTGAGSGTTTAPSGGYLPALPTPDTDTQWTDGGGSLIVANTFYATRTWVVVGVRIWNPADAGGTLLATDITVYAWARDWTGSRVGEPTWGSPDQSKTHTATRTAGSWTEILFDTPITINAVNSGTNDPDFVQVGYQYAGGADYIVTQLSTATGTVLAGGPDSYTSLNDGTVYMAEDGFGQGQNTFAENVRTWYGIDVLFGSLNATGAGTPTLTGHTAAGSGSTTAPGGGTAGSGSPTMARHTASGAGSSTAPGTGNAQLVRHTATGSGTSVPATVTGTAAVTLQRHTAAGVGNGARPTVAEENALTGDALPSISGYGDASNLGYSDEMSVDAGDTISFKVDGDCEVIEVYRLGHYGGDNARLVTTLTNTPTSQGNETTITDSNGATELSWTTTASWAVPNTALSGLYVALVRNAALNNGSYIPFVVRNDSRTADIVVGIPTATWGMAYNHYGGPSVGVTGGKNLYGSGTAIGSITDRSYAVSANRPIISRGGVQNHWDDYDWGLIDYLEESGFDVKYVASHDLDRDATSFNDAQVFISVGHDEYWSQGMRDNVEAFRDAGGHLIFLSANEVFWRVRWSGDYRTMWCYKDTMPGPGGHTAGDPLDPVSWTGTWRDTRWGSRDPESNLTGDFFRMNGLTWKTATVVAATYGSSPFWRSTTVNTGPTNLTVTNLLGFEADAIDIPASYGQVLLAATTVNINGAYANDDGQTYTNNGDLAWGVVMHQNAPTSGVVVSVGTMAWNNALSNVHATDSTYPAESSVIRQATANLLYDMGATGDTLAVATTPTPVTDIISDYAITYPSYTGTGSPTLASRTATGVGSTTVPSASGTGSPSLARHTAAGSGFTGTSGSGSPALTRHTAGGSGLTAGLVGSAGVALVRHAATGAGSTVAPASPGTGLLPLARHTGSGSGTTVAPAVAGTGTLLLERHTAAGFQRTQINRTGPFTTTDLSPARTTTDLSSARTTTEQIT